MFGIVWSLSIGTIFGIVHCQSIDVIFGTYLHSVQGCHPQKAKVWINVLAKVETGIFVTVEINSFDEFEWIQWLQLE